MIFQIDERFVEESTRLKLQYTCQECAFFNEDEVRCGQGFPTEPHLRPRNATLGERLFFCKDFTAF